MATAPCLTRAILLGYDKKYEPKNSLVEWNEDANILANQIGIIGTEMENRDLEKIILLEQFKTWRLIIVNAMMNIDYVVHGKEWLKTGERHERDTKTIYVFNGDEHYYWLKTPAQALFKSYRPTKNNIVLNCYVCFQSHKDTLFPRHKCALLEQDLFGCDKCGKQCSNKGALSVHKRSAKEYDIEIFDELEDSEFNCTSCGKHFKEFYSLSCFAYHQSTCMNEDEDTTHCDKCNRNYCGNHDCDNWGLCSNCGLQLTSREHSKDHPCYFKGMLNFHSNFSEDKYHAKIWKSHWVYDFETCRAIEESEGVYKHEVFAWGIQLVKPDVETITYMNAQNYYLKFEMRTRLYPDIIYTRIGDSLRFHGKSMQSFIKCCEGLTESKGKNKMHPTFWAHNGARFDGKFILDYYLNDMKMDLSGVSFEETEDHGWAKVQYTPKKSNIQLTMVGTRALKIKVKNMSFKCSLAHLAGPLRELPEIFGLENELSKGEFPYGRLIKDNWGTIMKFPDIEEFDLDSKPFSRRTELIEWYAKQDTSQPWDFDKELWNYLFADIDVLSQVLGAYDKKAQELQHALVEKYNQTAREFLNEGTYVSPLDFATAPAWSLAIYRTWFLPKDRVAILRPAQEKFIRESLHGGRTDKRCNWIKIDQEGDSLEYDDFTSLYPSVQKTTVHETHYPVGIPEWGRWNGSTSNEELIEQMENKTGYLRISTKHLKFVTHPTLPYLGSWDEDAREQKLLFANIGHVRQVFGWPEILEAIVQGEIEVTEIHETLLFDKGQVFDDYVDFFFSVKDEAEKSGNEGLRSLAKLLLNSLWGKLGQKSYPIREWISDAGRREFLWDKFSTGEYQLMSIVDKSETRVHVTYRMENDYSNLVNTACHLAAFVSMWGRIILHRKVLAVHGARALYCDTDSGVIYLRKGETVSWKGNGLGMLVSEIKKMVKKAGYKLDLYDAAIVESVFVVPKTYGMIIEIKNKITNEKTQFTKVICKGFEVSYANSKKVTYQAMKDLVFTQYGINAFLNGKREMEDVEKLSYIPGSKRLTFRSSLANGQIAPREAYVSKAMRGIYTKGKEHPTDPRFIIPFGNHEPTEETFLSNREKHFE